MKNLENIKFLTDYFNSTRIIGSLEEIIVDMVILIVLSLILSLIYIKSAYSLSNRKRLASTFPILALTTMMIILVIKSSLALSLGLVGALSIIRFRSAIKEPEELVYIFLAVSLGLGFGAKQREVSIVFFVAITLFIIIRTVLQKKFNIFSHKTDQSIYLNLKTTKKQIKTDGIVAVLKKYCHFIDFKRMDDSDKNLEFLFLVKVTNLENITQIKDELKKIDSEISISFLNSEELFS